MDIFEKHQEKITEDIRSVFQDNLSAVILYGSYVRGDYITGRSDINLLIVRKERKNTELSLLNKKIVKWVKKIRLAYPLVLTEAELKNSTDVYPMEYFDIKDFHKLIQGKDIFNTLEINHTNLRLELETQIKSRLIYFRQTLVNHNENTAVLRSVLLTALTSYHIIIKNILKLLNTPFNNDLANNLKNIESRLSFPITSVQRIYEWKIKQRRLNKKEIITLYGDMVSETEKLADFIDGFKIG